jgi:hypothetical protein
MADASTIKIEWSASQETRGNIIAPLPHVIQHSAGTLGILICLAKPFWGG